MGPGPALTGLGPQRLASLVRRRTRGGLRLPCGGGGSRGPTWRSASRSCCSSRACMACTASCIALHSPDRSVSTVIAPDYSARLNSEYEGRTNKPPPRGGGRGSGTGSGGGGRLGQTALGRNSLLWIQKPPDLRVEIEYLAALPLKRLCQSPLPSCLSKIKIPTHRKVRRNWIRQTTQTLYFILNCLFGCQFSNEH